MQKYNVRDDMRQCDNLSVMGGVCWSHWERTWWWSMMIIIIKRIPIIISTSLYYISLLSRGVQTIKYMISRISIILVVWVWLIKQIERLWNLVNPTWQTSLKAIFFGGGLEGSTLPKGQIYIFCTLSALSLFQIATPLTGVSILRFQSDTDISQLCISLSI